MFNYQTKVGNPELRGRSTGSMVTNFVLGITFSNEIWGLCLHFTQISFENVTQEKIPNPSRRLIFSGGLYILN